MSATYDKLVWKDFIILGIMLVPVCRTSRQVIRTRPSPLLHYDRSLCDVLEVAHIYVPHTVSRWDSTLWSSCYLHKQFELI